MCESVSVLMCGCVDELVKVVFENKKKLSDFFCVPMATNVPKQDRVLVSVEELDQKIRDVAFEGRIMNRYGTFDLIAKGAMKNPNYSYLYCDLLDRDGYTTITMMIKNTSMNLIEEHQACLQKGLYVRVENFGLEERTQKNFQKGDMPVIIVVGTTTIISAIPPFQPDLEPIFFHTESIQEFRSKWFNKYACTSLAVIVVGVRGETKVQVGDKPRDPEKQLMVADGPNF
jgi:hypothetical protein